MRLIERIGVGGPRLRAPISYPEEKATGYYIRPYKRPIALDWNLRVEDVRVNAKVN